MAKKSEDKPLVVQSATYNESEDFVPNPTDHYGTLDTTGTAGAADSRLEEISKVFEVAKKADLVQAGKALDPEDDSVHESLVVLPEGHFVGTGDPEGARKRVANAAAAAAKNPVVLGGPSDSQKQAAESGPDAALESQKQQENTGAGSTPGGDADKQDEVQAKAGGSASHKSAVQK